MTHPDFLALCSLTSLVEDLSFCIREENKEGDKGGTRGNICRTRKGIKGEQGGTFTGRGRE